MSRRSGFFADAWGALGLLLPEPRSRFATLDVGSGVLVVGGMYAGAPTDAAQTLSAAAAADSLGGFPGPVGTATIAGQNGGTLVEPAGATWRETGGAYHGLVLGGMDLATRLRRTGVWGFWMNVRSILLSAVLTAAACSPAVAQGGAGIELGGYGAWFVPDGDVASSSGAGGGARVTVPFARRLALDIDLGWYSAGAGNLTAFVPAAAVLFGSPSGADGPFIGTGYARPTFRLGGSDAVADAAVVALAGYRRFLGRHAAVRLEARALIVPASDLPGVDGALHGSLSLGVSLFPARAPDPDQDGDGVTDARDRCYGTPAGSVVDDRGCPRDSDGDGVANGADACPHTPIGTITTADGCPLDADGDQVYDGMDQCPATPAGAAVDLRGCPADGDGDGVLDGPDRCPQTPAGVAVDSAGCPRDSDADGVPDGPDRCPGTPRGVAVESDGCPVARGVADTLFTETRTSFELRGVNFETGKARLLPQATQVLDEVAAALMANPQWRVEVAGYTDSTGSAAVNRRLSHARANAVREFLVRRGVPASRLVARGYGPSDPVAPNTTVDGRARNRRVELRQLE